MKLPFLDKESPKPLLGLCVMYPAPGIVERIGPDWDWLWIDAQHGDLDWRDAVDLVRASQLIQRPGLVRVPSQDSTWIGKVLDSGAAGVIVPLVESVAEAQAVVRAAKFPPLGNRSYGGRRIIDLQGRGYYKTADQDTALILQVESSAACSIAEELLALEGVDGLFLGPDDLLIRDGFDVDSPKNMETIGRQMKVVADACRKVEKWSVCVGVSDSARAMARDFGFGLVVGGGDVPFLASGSKAEAEKMRGYFAMDSSPVPPTPGILY